MPYPWVCSYVQKTAPGITDIAAYNNITIYIDSQKVRSEWSVTIHNNILHSWLAN